MVRTAVTRRPRLNRAIPREDLRQRIFEAALSLFRETGYEAATIEVIARRAGVAKGTLFNFFPTKGAVLLEHYRSLDARFLAALEELSPAQPRASLAKWFGRAERIMRAEGPLMDSIVRETLTDAALRRADLDSGALVCQRLATFVEACQKKGTMAPGLRARIVADVVVDLWSATTLRWVREGCRFSLQRRLVSKLEVAQAGWSPRARRTRAR